MGVYGTRIFGVTDEVPGLFFVATKFCHINYFPLIPLKGLIVLGRFSYDGNARAMQTDISVKSVMLAWIRVIAIALAFNAAIALFVGVTDPDHSRYVPIAGPILPLACGIAYLVGWHSCTRHATPQRAREIAARIGGNAPALVESHLDAYTPVATGTAVIVDSDTHDDNNNNDGTHNLELKENKTVPVAVPVGEGVV